MAFAAIAGAIRSRFATEVGTPQALPIVHDNAPEPAKAAQWCRLRIDFTGKEQRSTGATPRYRTFGSVTAELYAAVEKGDGAVLTLADAVGAAFLGVRLSSPAIRFFPPAPVGTSQVGAWYRRDIRFQFEADTIGE